MVASFICISNVYSSLDLWIVASFRKHLRSRFAGGQAVQCLKGRDNTPAKTSVLGKTLNEIQAWSCYT